MAGVSQTYGGMRFGENTSSSQNTRRSRDYKRECSLDSSLNSNSQPAGRVQQPKRQVIPIPILHERQARNLARTDDRFDRRSESVQNHRINSERLIADDSRQTYAKSGALDASKEDILFSKASGVTRIPAQRVRRHSVQFDGVNSLWNRINSQQYTPNVRAVPVQPDILHSPRQTVSKTPDYRYTRVRVITPEIKEFTREENPFFSSAFAKPESNISRQNPEQFTRARHCEPGGVQRVISPAITHQTEIHQPERYDLSSLSSAEMPGITAHAYSPIPVDLTPEQSTNSSHIVCYKNALQAQPPAFATKPSGIYQASTGTGMFNMDPPRRMSISDPPPDEILTVRKPALQIRRPSLTSATPSEITSDRSRHRPDVMQSFPRQTPAPRRHSVSTTSGYGSGHGYGNENTIGQILAHARSTAPSSGRSTPVHDNLPKQPVGLQLASLTPVRRYSVTYIPRTDGSDSETSSARDTSRATTPSEEKVRSRKRVARRRCRPLSIVKEGDLPAGVDPSDTNAINNVSQTQHPDKSAISIESDDKNVNIVAGGNVHISLNTDKPLSMVGRSGPDNSSGFSLWTQGAKPVQPYSPTYDEDIDGPIGMWRDGNVMVDSVSPRPRAQRYGQDNAHAPMYPGAPSTRPMYYPYMGRSHANGYARLDAPTPQDKSLYSPLQVDVGQTTPHYVPMLMQAPPTYSQHDVHQNDFVNRAGSCVNRTAPKVTELPNIANGISVEEELSPIPQFDVRDMIKNFENKSDKTQTKPEFGITYGSREGSRSRRVSVDSAFSAVTKNSAGSQTDRASDEGEKYELKVEEGAEKWMNVESPGEKVPSTIHAYIAEMSLSEVRYANGTKHGSQITA